MRGRRTLLDLFTKSAGEWLDEWFESAPIKALYGFDSIVGNFASPYTPGSAYVLLHHVFGEVGIEDNHLVGVHAHLTRPRRVKRLDADEDMELQEPFATGVFRIVQESLTNIARHAQASEARIAIERNENFFFLEVRGGNQYA